MMDGSRVPQNTGHTPNSSISDSARQSQSPLAPGFQTIVQACQKLYPEQKNPLQLSTAVKFWLGGPDPLDYITVYSNQEDCTHWHYVTCGLTDLHGDGRVHPPAASPEAPSGYGFELTFRLRRLEELTPPVWPVTVLQKITKYVFETENKLAPGDHIIWSQPLGSPHSILKHLILAEDVQLPPISGSLGKLGFLQVFCVTDDELEAVQRWNGPGVIRLLRNSPVSPGNLLVTDVQRKHSLFSLVPEAKNLVEAGIAKEGSNLCGMSACISWTETDVTASRERELGGAGALSDWDSLSQQCDRLINTASGLTSHARVSYPRSVALACNLETAGYLPLCIQGRLLHGFHFTLKSVLKETAVTFLTERVAGSLVSPEKPFATQGSWLQILVAESFLPEFQRQLVQLQAPDLLKLPLTIRVTDHLSITVFDDVGQV